MYGVKKRISGGTFKRVTSLLIAFVFLFTSTGIQASFADNNFEWFDTAGDVGKYSSIGLNSSGTPIACYSANGSLKFSTLNSSNIVVDSGNVGDYCSMKVSGNNIHVSYYDASLGDLKYAQSTNSGSSWSVEAVDTGTAVGKFTSIAVDPSGYPHISYYDEQQGDLKHAYKDSSGIWRFDNATETQAARAGQHSAIAVDSSGNVHISYYESDNKDLWYAYKSGPSFSIRAVDNNGDVGQYSSIAVNSSNRAMISYYDATNANLKYAYQNSSGSWQTSTVNDTVNSGSVGLVSSIACDSNGRPHISYLDATNAKLRYAFLSGSSWQTLLVDSMSTSAGSTSIVLDSQNQAHISYYDASNDTKYSGINIPLVTGTSPSSDASGAPVTGSINISFSKNIQTGRNWRGISLVDASVTYLYGQIVYGTTLSTTNTVSGNTVTLNHGLPLSYSTKYTVTVPQGAVKDSLGNENPAAFSFSFTTQTDTGPFVTSSVPVNGASGVELSKNITINFNENVTISKGISLSFKNNDGADVLCEGAVKDNVLSIKPGFSSSTNYTGGYVGGNNFSPTAGYTYGKTYTLTIPSGYVKDSAGNPLASAYTLTYSTIPQGPYVAVTDPSIGAAEVPLTKTIVLTFADNIFTNTSWSSITLKDSNSNTISTSNSISGKTLTIDPSSNFTMNLVYTLKIPADAVKDSAGKKMAADFAMSFTAVKSYVPAVPTKVKIKATTASTISVIWNKSDKAQSYNVYRRTGKEGFTKMINTTLNGYTDVAVAKKTTYVYAITASGTGGESAKSSEVPAYIGMTLPQFADVSNGDWFKVYVDALAKRNAVGGYSDEMFHPES
ncbi:MAG: Ig-like domain-containing protein, partial [Rubrobacteridae bacterium]|nr:Ig-like domain-containing protein [Rubrobacteridae bacterium]